MRDEQIAQKIRAELRKTLPDTIYQVSYVNRNLHLRVAGGKLRYDEFSTTEIQDMVVDAIQRVIPDFYVTEFVDD